MEIPRDELTVVTGLSGSGKSSLAFETIYAEGQRRYIESLSAYARNFLGQMDKPQVEAVEGLSPAISIDQKNAANNPRSTVGTVTELHDYLRLLYARVGTQYALTGEEVGEQSAQDMVTQILSLPDGTRAKMLLPSSATRRGVRGPVRRPRRRRVQSRRSRRRGVRSHAGPTRTGRKLRPHHRRGRRPREDSPDARSRIADCVETALEEADGTLKVSLPDPAEGAAETLGGSDARATGDVADGEEDDGVLRTESSSNSPRTLPAPTAVSTSPKSRRGRSRSTHRTVPVRSVRARRDEGGQRGPRRHRPVEAGQARLRAVGYDRSYYRGNWTTSPSTSASTSRRRSRS